MQSVSPNTPSSGSHMRFALFTRFRHLFHLTHHHKIASTTSFQVHMNQSSIKNSSETASRSKKQRRARTAHNLSTPIGRLPNELLAQILEEVVRTHPHGEYWGPPTLGWARMMLSCSRIYTVATSTPALWATIHCNYKKTTIKARLLRAGTARLSLVVSPGWIKPGPGYQDPWDNAADLLERARSLVIDLGPDDMHSHRFMGRIDSRALVESFNTSAPFLEVLDCSNMHLMYNRWLMSDSFLNGSCLRLVDLATDMLVLTDTSPDFPALQSLRLEYPACGEDYGRLRALLTKTPALQYLWLLEPNKGHIDHNEEELTSTDTIGLPNLRTLHLRASRITSSNILSFLPDPSTNFHLDLHPLEPSSSLWSFETQHQHAKLLNRISRFWQQTTGRTCLPDGLLQARPTPSVNVDGNDELSFGWDFTFSDWGWNRTRDVFVEPYVHYRVFGGFSNSGECAAFGDVKTFSGFNAKRSRFSLQSYIELLPGIENIVVREFVSWEEARALVDWIQSHASRPLNSVQFRDCAEGMETAPEYRALHIGGGARNISMSILVSSPE